MKDWKTQLAVHFYLLTWHFKPKVEIWKFYLIPLLAFFVFTHYHPQWLIWITPLLILDLVKSKFKNIVPHALILLSWFTSLFFFDPSLAVGIFAPIVPILQNAQSIWTLLHINVDYNLSRSLIQTIFVGASLYLIYQNFTIAKKNNQ